MSKRTMNLGGNAVDLLLAIAETPDMVISAVALRDYDGGVGSLLVDAGALKSDGFEPVAASQADHDDAVVSLIWNGEKGGYAYFSPAVGLVRVDDDALVRFRLDVRWFLGWIAGQLGFGTNASQVNLVPGQLWDFGDTWLGERKSARCKTAIYVARRLNQPETMAQVQEVLQARSGRPSGVILTTTQDSNLARVLSVSACAVLPIKGCARAGSASFAIDTTIVYAAAHGARPVGAGSPIQVDGEFRLVRIGQREFHFRGDKQRQVVGFLHQKWNEGHGPVSTALMFTELEFPITTRLRDLFKGRDDWKELIGYQDGSCWLRYDNLLAGDNVTSD
jgi:hypothetical protein